MQGFLSVLPSFCHWIFCPLMICFTENEKVFAQRSSREVKSDYCKRLCGWVSREGSLELELTVLVETWNMKIRHWWKEIVGSGGLTLSLPLLMQCLWRPGDWAGSSHQVSFNQGDAPRAGPGTCSLPPCPQMVLGSSAWMVNDALITGEAKQQKCSEYFTPLPFILEIH